MQALTGVFIVRFVVRLVVIDSDSSQLLVVLFLLSGSLSLFIEFGFANRFLNYLEGLVFLLLFLALGCLLFIFIDKGILIAHLVIVTEVEGAHHQTFVLGGDFLRSSAVDHVGIVASANKDRAKSNSEIKRVSFLPVEHISYRRDVLGQLVGLSQFFVV